MWRNHCFVWDILHLPQTDSVTSAVEYLPHGSMPADRVKPSRTPQGEIPAFGEAGLDRPYNKNPSVTPAAVCE